MIGPKSRQTIYILILHAGLPGCVTCLAQKPPVVLGATKSIPMIQSLQADLEG